MKDEKVFYVKPENVVKKSFFLDQSESAHAIHVLRLKKGERITLFDGKGRRYFGKIININHDIISGKIEKEVFRIVEENITINIAPSIIKRKRFENLLEKATELGVKKIEPLIMHRSIKKTINMKRCKKIILSAAKQCNRSYLPVLLEPVKFLSWINKLNSNLLAGLQSTDMHLNTFNFDSKESFHIIIGPEGDFSNEEIKVMKRSNVKFFTLGNRRLRSETAMISSISILNELLN